MQFWAGVGGGGGGGAAGRINIAPTTSVQLKVPRDTYEGGVVVNEVVFTTINADCLISGYDNIIEGLGLTPPPLLEYIVEYIVLHAVQQTTLWYR